MFKNSEIISCFKGLIGFEASYNAEVENIDEELLSSSSGVRIGSGLHPLLTHENILACAQNFGRVTVRPHSVTLKYFKDAVTQKGAKYYYSLQDENLNHDPEQVSSLWWKETTLYSAFLRKVYNSSVSKLMNQIFTLKRLNEATKQLLANVVLYEGVGNINKRITKSGRFVGLKLNLRFPDTVAMLNVIGLQLDTAQNPVTLYLYHSSQSEAVKTIVINQTKSVSFQWHKITSEILAFMNDNVNAGGSYYLGYYEDDITGQAIQKEVNWQGVQPCGTCSEAVANKMIFGKWGKFLQVQSFYVNASDLNVDKTLWDEERELYVDNTNFGLNIQLAVQCDVSTWLCQHSNGLTDALSKQLTFDLLSEMVFSLRDNQSKQKIAGLAAAAVDNQENGQPGEFKKLEDAIKAVDFDFSDLSPVCNPCNDGKFQPRKTSVWGR